MADENQIIGGGVFRFKNIDGLHKYLAKLDDSREIDFAQHRYLKRDGAQQEKMSRQPHAFTATFNYVGPTWIKDFRAFLKSVEEDPAGVLNHPIYGEMRAVYKKAQSTFDVVAAGNAATVTAFFVEDNLDTSLSNASGQGVAAKAQAVTAAIDDLELAMALYPSVSAAAAMLTTAAADFADAVSASASSRVADPSIPAALDDTATAAEHTIASLRADPLATSDADIYDAIKTVERLYAACQELMDAARSEKPPMVRWTVPATMSVYQIAGLFYGADGLERADEVLSNNPSIPNPAAILVGTVLLMATATV